MKHLRTNREKGMTLIEVMGATVVLLLVFISSITSIQMGYRLVEVARDTNTAGQALQSQMEEIRGLHWTDIQAMSGTWSAWTNVNAIEEFTGISNKFQYRRRAVALSSAIKQVEVQVQWTAIDGMPRQRTFMNFFAQHGVSDYYYSK